MVLELNIPLSYLIQEIEMLKWDDGDVQTASLSELGFCIVRQAFNSDFIKSTLSEYKSGGGLTDVPHHSTLVTINNNYYEQLLHNSEGFLKIIESGFFNGNVAAQPAKIFRKDPSNQGAVILHNDIDYTPGNAEKYSIFIALTDCDQENGGLILFPGSHHFASLGNAGEIDESILPKDFPQIAPNLQPGDCLIMHSALWHKSEKPKVNKQRIILEVCIHSADDPWLGSGKIVKGQRTNQWTISGDKEKIFSNSRSQKLRDLYEQLKESKEN